MIATAAAVSATTGSRSDFGNEQHFNADTGRADFMGFVVDITLIAGFRPELLRRTLESFATHVFPHFSLGTVHVNLDPFMGDAEDGRRCRSILSEHFEAPIVHTPQTPSFGAAVKHVWSATGDNHVLHLEDDWLCLADIGPEMVRRAFDEKTGMVALAQKKQPASVTKGYRKLKRKVFGVTVYSSRISKFGTSPCFLRPGLCRQYGLLMDPSKDPEKQVYRNANARLCALQRQYDYKTLAGEHGEPLIMDIGRDYRRDLDLHKINLESGESIWVKGKDKRP